MIRPKKRIETFNFYLLYYWNNNAHHFSEGGVQPVEGCQGDKWTSDERIPTRNLSVQTPRPYPHRQHPWFDAIFFKLSSQLAGGSFELIIRTCDTPISSKFAVYLIVPHCHVTCQLIRGLVHSVKRMENSAQHERRVFVIRNTPSNKRSLLWLNILRTDIQ